MAADSRPVRGHNPTLLADKLNIDESKAQEITAFLRPNPTFSLSVHGTQIAPDKGVWRPFAGTFETPSISYLHERQHKRELRLKARKKLRPDCPSSATPTWERSLLFNLRSAFFSALQAKAVLQLAKITSSITISPQYQPQDRFNAGDIAQIDLDRLELQRVQYESDLQAAEEGLANAKIQLLTLLNDRTPIEQVDVTGPFDFSDQLMPRDEFREDCAGNAAGLESRGRGRGQSANRSQTRRCQRIDRPDIERMVYAQFIHQ